MTHDSFKTNNKFRVEKGVSIIARFGQSDEGRETTPSRCYYTLVGK